MSTDEKQTPEQKIQGLESQVQILTARLDEAQTIVKTVDQEKVCRAVAVAAAAAGVLPAAIEDVVNRAIDEMKKGAEIAPDDFVKSLRPRRDAAHFWPRGDDADATVGDAESGAAPARGWKAMSVDEQTMLYRGDPDLARRLAAQAGTPIKDGAQAGPSPFAAGAPNPWHRDTWDDMGQAAAYRADPVKAEQLARAAGSRIGALKPI